MNVKILSVLKSISVHQVGSAFFSLLLSSNVIASELSPRVSFKEWKEKTIIYKKQAIGIWDCSQLTLKERQAVLHVLEDEVNFYLARHTYSYTKNQISHNTESFTANHTQGEKAAFKTNFLEFNYDLKMASYRLAKSGSHSTDANYQCSLRK